MWWKVRWVFCFLRGRGWREVEESWEEREESRERLEEVEATVEEEAETRKDFWGGAERRRLRIRTVRRGGGLGGRV